MNARRWWWWALADWLSGCVTRTSPFPCTLHALVLSPPVSVAPKTLCSWTRRACTCMSLEFAACMCFACERFPLAVDRSWICHAALSSELSILPPVWKWHSDAWVSMHVSSSLPAKPPVRNKLDIWNLKLIVRMFWDRRCHLSDPWLFMSHASPCSSLSIRRSILWNVISSISGNRSRCSVACLEFEYTLDSIHGEAYL
jgi:hypothetical protein